MISLRQETAAMLRALDLDVDGSPRDESMLRHFGAVVATVDAFGGSPSDAAVAFLLGVCAIRLPVWDVLPTSLSQESRTKVVVNFVSILRFYSTSVIIKNNADWLIDYTQPEEFAKIRGRLVRLEQLLTEGDWIKKPSNELGLSTILKLPEKRIRAAKQPKGLFGKLLRR